MYVFTHDHAAYPWNGEDVETVVLTDEITRTNSRIQTTASSLGQQITNTRNMVAKREGLIAAEAHDVGSYLTYQSSASIEKLYRVLAPIAVGDTLTVGTNIQEVTGGITGEMKADVANLKSVAFGSRRLQSNFVLGYLDANGNLGTYDHRATFSDYMRMSGNGWLVYDSGYEGTVCTYSGGGGRYTKLDRVSIGDGGAYYLPAGTIFRATIFAHPEVTITDLSAYIDKCHLVLDDYGYLKELGSSDDLNNIKTTGVYFSASKGVPANSPVAHDRTGALYGILKVWMIFNSTVVYQSFEDYRGNFFIRHFELNEGWAAWNEFADQADIAAITTDIAAITSNVNAIAADAARANQTKPLAAKIFKRVGCIGDSYTEGYINAGGVVQHRNDYAWPHYMEQLTGNTWTNFGVGGSSCKSWMDGGTYSKLADVQAAGNKCQAYVIGLMINDSDPSAHAYVPVGTTADIGTDADSYYAYYYKLVQAVHAVNADAPIFCNTCPKSESRFAAYNTAVRDIVAHCQTNNLPVYLCDLAGAAYNTTEFYKHPVFASDYINGHYSGTGYEMMAECYLRVLSDVVLANAKDFQTVHLIGYDEPQP